MPILSVGWSFGELMADGWTVSSQNDIVGTKASVTFRTLDGAFWPSQANHIFTTLQISSDLQHYVVVGDIRFELSVSTAEGNMTRGFLFLCPPEDFQIGETSFKWPDRPAYWSLDRSGVDQLTLEDAVNLGFPSFRLSTQFRGYSWDPSVYAGLRQFHQAKGFDPDSQDVARYLDHPLYQMAGPFAHIDDEYSGDGDDTSQYSTDEEFDNERDSTPMNHDSVLASTHQNMEQIPFSSAFGDIVDSTSGLLPIDREASAAYGYNIQPNQSFTTSDFSTSDFNFDAYNFGNDLSSLDSFVSNDPDPSLSSLNYQPPMLSDAAHYFPATSFPQLPTNLPVASSFQIASIVDAPVAVSSLIYPTMLHDASQLFHTTPLPQLPTSLPVASFFPIAP
ncbi:hypothetical protein B0H14DRAFT_114617 [Mycena olivaceomarginata]|nr:hypothetical protein B0H14DRAFT_114617 [Mycena olivaceomarginata]